MSEVLRDPDITGRYIELKAYAVELTKNYNMSVEIKDAVITERGVKKYVYFVFNPATKDVYHTCEDIFQLTGILVGMGTGKLEFTPEVVF